MPHDTLDLIIHGGTVIDGTRAPRFDADVGLRDGRIAALGDLSQHPARERVDATGLIVAPGFIDAHTHDDTALLGSPDMSFKVSQGVTTVIAGNCGISAAPLPADRAMPSPLDLLSTGPGSRFDRMAAYFDAYEARPAAVNVAALAGHTSLRACTMDRFDRAASGDEIAAMHALLARAMDDGAIGLSAGTYYPPAAHAPTEEIIAVGRAMTGRGGLYVTHMRDEADRVMESLDESFRIGREIDVPVVISHHKLSGKANFGRSKETLGLLKRTMACQCVGLDCYPYTAGSTMIQAERAMLDSRMVIASSVPHPECVGREITDIAAEWGVAKDEAARRLQPGSAIYFLMDEADVRDIMAFDATMIGSDGIPLGDKPHPRLWGTFPRVLGHYSRDVGLFPLETAVWKMTGLTARHFGLAGRGTLAVGAHADLVLFDAVKVRDTASYDEPKQAAEGIVAVIVNGAVTWQGGRHTGARPGAVLRRDPGLARRSSGPVV